MADKVIHLRIDVKKINKAWLYEGEKGTYLDCVCLFNEVQDGYGSNGMIIQSVPTAVYKKDKETKGEILGNSKVWPKGGNGESVPGGGNAKKDVAESQAADVADDLPF